MSAAVTIATAPAPALAMSPIPDLPEPKSVWEWITGGVFALLAILAAIGRWLRRPPERPATMEPSQLDRIEKSIDLLCRVLTSPNEDGYPVSASRKLADRLEARLDRIEKKLGARHSTTHHSSGPG